jgi:hypothetical protein
MEWNTDRGLAVFGIALAIVMLVLDKAGKLKGTLLLLVLLAVAISLLIPISWSIPWVASPIVGSQLWARRFLMVFILGGVWAILSVWVTYGDGSKRLPEHSSISPVGLPSQTQPEHQPVVIKRGSVEIFFNGRIRGKGVTFASDSQKEKLLLQLPDSDTPILVLPILPGEKEVKITLFIRNVASVPIKNLRVFVTSDRRFHSLSNAFRFRSTKELEFDSPTIYPYNATGEDHPLTILFPPTTTVAPAPLIVTVDGDNLSQKHSELVYIATFAIPSATSQQ